MLEELLEFQEVEEAPLDTRIIAIAKDVVFDQSYAPKAREILIEKLREKNFCTAQDIIQGLNPRRARLTIKRTDVGFEFLQLVDSETGTPLYDVTRAGFQGFGFNVPKPPMRWGEHKLNLGDTRGKIIQYSQGKFLALETSWEAQLLLNPNWSPIFSGSYFHPSWQNHKFRGNFNYNNFSTDNTGVAKTFAVKGFGDNLSGATVNYSITTSEQFPDKIAQFDLRFGRYYRGANLWYSFRIIFNGKEYQVENGEAAYSDSEDSFEIKINPDGSFSDSFKASEPRLLYTILGDPYQKLDIVKMLKAALDVASVEDVDRTTGNTLTSETRDVIKDLSYIY